MKEYKKVMKMFTADKYDSEEKFLRDMSLAGWHFDSTFFIVYTFVKGTPRDYSYRLDLKNNSTDDRDNYFSIYEDYGWEHVFEFKVFSGAWEYFRKETTDGEEELYTDNNSKIEYLERIKRFYDRIAIFILVLNAVNIINSIIMFMHGVTELGIFIIVLLMLLALFWGSMLVNIRRKIHFLKERSQK